MNMVVVFISLTVFLAGVASSSVSADWENLLTSWVESDVDAVNAVSHSAAATDFDAELAADLSNPGGSAAATDFDAELAADLSDHGGSGGKLWMTLASQDISKALFSSTARSSFTQGTSASDGAFMKLPANHATSKKNGVYTFRLTYRGTKTKINSKTFDQLTASKPEYRTATWTQTNWLTSTTPGTFKCLDDGCNKWMQSGHDSTYWRHGDRRDGCTAFEGIVKSSSGSAVLDGTHKSGCWWLCVGCVGKHEGGIPAAMGQIADTMKLEMLTGTAAGGAGYAFLFNGCPRGGKAQTWTNKGRMNKTQCEKLCDADPECNAIEVNGCLSGPQCGGECYNFHGTGSDLRNGNCVTTGDQKAYAKPASTPAPTAAPTKGGSPAPPGHYGLRDVIERSPIPQCVPGGVNNKNTYDSVNKAACFGLSQEQCESSLDCTYHSSCTASISLSKHPDADEIFKLFPSLKGKNFTCSCDETIQLAQVQQVWGSYLAGKDYRIHTNNCKAMAGSDFFGGWKDFCPKLTKRLDCVATPWCEDAHVDAKQTRAQQMMHQLMTCAKAKCSKCGTSGYGTEQLLDTELDNVDGCDPTIWGRRRLL